jgi:hypothetical protein
VSNYWSILTLVDGRRGYFYRTPICGNLMFQPVDLAGDDDGDPEMVFDEHEVAETTQ